MDTLLVEIGAEEIPAGYIASALKSFSALLSAGMSAARIDHGSFRTFGTPRRLVVEVSDVAEKQKALSAEVTGPPARIGFDADGNPTVAAKKFAEKVGVPVGRLKIVKTGKGEYLCARRVERGLATRTVLKSILPEVITAISFPKTMHWADLDIFFARPITSVLALLGDKVVSFAVGNIQSNRLTCGHSFMRPGRIRIDATGDYIEKLRDAYVIADIDERRNLVKQAVSKAALKAGGRILSDEELLEIVTNLVEYPVATAGSFDAAFLEIPREILITAMREHQKYFAVVDQKQQLMPNFVAVNNTLTKDMDLVARGHERVLRARLSDAGFFYKSDLEIPPDARVEKLKSVLFQAKLGSMYEKSMRVVKITEFLADGINADPDFKNQIQRAARLCKSDLVSQVVIEFTKLQGVMGRVYAAAAGEAEAVANAIEEHYRPTYSGGPLPKTAIGALLSIADKMDSICGCFSVGLVPTGAADPYALRRQGIGIIQIMLDQDFVFSLSELITFALSRFKDKTTIPVKETAGQVYDFLVRRMNHLLVEEGFSKDVVAAITEVSADHVLNVWNRVKALEELKAAPDFEPLATAFKRVVNIMKKTDLTNVAAVDAGLFEDAAETALYEAFLKVKNSVETCFETADFNQAFLDIASLRNVVDDFFEKVLVMTKEDALRINRLALLGEIAGLFGRVADFSRITT